MPKNLSSQRRMAVIENLRELLAKAQSERSTLRRRIARLERSLAAAEGRPVGRAAKCCKCAKLEEELRRVKNDLVSAECAARMVIAVDGGVLRQQADMLHLALKAARRDLPNDAPSVLEVDFALSRMRIQGKKKE